MKYEALTLTIAMFGLTDVVLCGCKQSRQTIRPIRTVTRVAGVESVDIDLGHTNETADDDRQAISGATLTV